MKKYSTLMLDAIDTVIEIDRPSLSRHVAAGRTMQTTVPKVHSVYEELMGEVDFDLFLDAFLEGTRRADRIREESLREVPITERFLFILEVLGCPGAEPGLAGRLAAAHTTCLGPALKIPPSNTVFLEWLLERGYSIGLVSNFDHAPTLYECLEQHGVREMFGSVVISAEVGWCKPHPAIFERALKELEIGPSECLFVGDRPELDVAGPAALGMDAVLINSRNEDWDTGGPRPLCTIRTLPDLAGILDRGGAR